MQVIPTEFSSEELDQWKGWLADQLLPDMNRRVITVFNRMYLETRRSIQLSRYGQLSWSQSLTSQPLIGACLDEWWAVIKQHDPSFDGHEVRIDCYEDGQAKVGAHEPEGSYLGILGRARLLNVYVNAERNPHMGTPGELLHFVNKEDVKVAVPKAKHCSFPHWQLWFL